MSLKAISNKTTAVILAAGKSTRMQSSFSKVLHKIYGKPMLEYVVDSAKSCGIKDIIIVTNTDFADIKRECSLPKNIRMVRQNRLLGTAHALKQVEKLKTKSNLLVLCGDAPLLSKNTLARLLGEHDSRQAAATLLTAHIQNPTGYGRIIRRGAQIIDIIEEIDTNETEKKIREINSGIYCFKKSIIFKILHKIKRRQNKKEYYLTDAVKKMNENSISVFGVMTSDDSEVRGVNTRAELAKAHSIVKDRIQDTFLTSGVAIMDRATTEIYNEVAIDQDTIIYPFTVIESDVKIGKKCRIGPFACIKGGTRIGDNCEVGNFVELSGSQIGTNVKISHHSFLSDVKIGEGSSVGACTITVKGSSREKSYKTIIGKNVNISAGALIIPPVKVSNNSVVEAGTIIRTNGTTLQKRNGNRVSKQKNKRS